jgi:iron complex outermembrane receptor protein
MNNNPSKLLFENCRVSLGLAGAARVLAGLAIGACAVIVQAQGDSQARRLEEVVVTAQKRTESLQNVPISISVVGAKELSELAIFDFTETAKLTPGVNLFPGVQSAAIRLRGVGPAFFTLSSPQSVSVFVDEFSQSSVGAVFSTLVDVERIELLRGPQGTLYGQNAPGGAYNISTRAPNTKQLEGYVEASYGQQNSSSLESVDLRGAINLPLIDDVLALRVAGVYADSDGYVQVDNPVNAESSTGGKEHQALRSRMLWVLNPEMDLTWNVNYQDLDDTPVDLFNVEGIVPGTGGANPIPAVHTRFRERRYFGDFNSKSQAELRDTSLHWRWSQDVVNVDLLASYQEFDTHTLDNRAPYPGFLETFDIRLDWETTTAEARVSNSGETLDYLFGLYYAKREGDGDTDLILNGVGLEGPASGSDETLAAFANVTFHLSTQWDISAGLRYEENDLYTFSDFSFLGLNAVIDDEESYDHLSWSLKLRHYFSENHTAYIAIDNASKRGGFNNLTPGAVLLEGIFPEIAAVGEQMLIFDQETSTAFEIGFKGLLADERLSYNLALFYQQFDDHQITQPLRAQALITPVGNLNALFQNQLTNADEVLTQGLELELNYLLAQYWDVGLRLAYFDATIEEWNFRFCGQGEEESSNQLFCPADSGDPLNALPQWSSNFQLGHSSPINTTTNLYGRLNWSWRAEPNFTSVTDDWDSPRSRFDLTLGLQFTELGLDVRLWGKNLENEDLNTNPIIRGEGDPSLPQPYSGAYYPGRQYGITLAYSFQ